MNPYIEELKKFGTVDSHRHDSSYAFPQGGWAITVTRPNGSTAGEVGVTEGEVARSLLHFLSRKKPNMSIFEVPK